MLTGIYHVQLPVRDLDAAARWYADQLGFAITVPPDGRVAFLARPDDSQFLMLWQTDDAERANFSVAGETFPVVLYRTGDIHALHDRLAAAGAPITTFADEGHHWVLKFYDPDGNMWGALQDNP